VPQEILNIAEDYLDAVNEQDIEALGKNLHPQLHFKASMCEIDGRQNFLDHTEKFFTSIKGLEIRARFSSSNHTFFLYDLFFNNSLGMSRTANLMTFENRNDQGNGTRL
jgi:predicted ester cyclase